MSIWGPVLPAQGLYEQSATQRHTLGTPIWTLDGRKYIYAQAGASNLTLAYLCYAPSTVAYHTNQAVAAAAAAGSYDLSLTLGATAFTAADYTDGWVNINDAAGEGNMYRLRGGSYADTDASGTLTCKVVEQIRTALTTDSEYSLTKNKYCKVVHSNTDENIAVGFTPIAVTALYFFWLQVEGVGPSRASDTSAIGVLMNQDNTTAGVVAGITAGTLDPDVPWVGRVYPNTLVSGEHRTIDIKIF